MCRVQPEGTRRILLIKPPRRLPGRSAVATLRAANPPTSQQPNWQAQHLTRRPLDSASLRLPTSLNLTSLFFLIQHRSPRPSSDQNACSFATIILPFAHFSLSRIRNNAAMIGQPVSTASYLFSSIFVSKHTVPSSFIGTSHASSIVIDLFLRFHNTRLLR